MKKSAFKSVCIFSVSSRPTLSKAIYLTVPWASTQGSWPRNITLLAICAPRVLPTRLPIKGRLTRDG